MKFDKRLLITSFLFCTLTHAQEVRLIIKPSLYFETLEHVEISSRQAVDFESFQRNWAQFEIQVPKNIFPIAAPNCKEKIIIRFKGIDPSEPSNLSLQTERWDLMQKIRSKKTGEKYNLLLTLDTRYYMSKTSTGEYRLEYCNVFVE